MKQVYYMDQKKKVNQPITLIKYGFLFKNAYQYSKK